MLFSATVPFAAAGALERVSLDPALAYMAFATVLLAGVAVAGGVARRDWRALRTPSTIAKLAAAILVAVLCAHAAAALGSAFGPDAGVWGRLEGVLRAPLYVAALAYGPTAGVLAGVGYLAVAELGGTPSPASPVLVIELAVLGWLAIFPSPWRFRWAGPLDACLAYLLAWATGGLLLLEARGDGVSAPTIAAQHEGMLLGAIVTVALLTAVGPRAYRAAFPESRLQAAERQGSAERPL